MSRSLKQLYVLSKDWHIESSDDGTDTYNAIIQCKAISSNKNPNDTEAIGLVKDLVLSFDDLEVCENVNIEKMLLDDTKELILNSLAFNNKVKMNPTPSAEDERKSTNSVKPPKKFYSLAFIRRKSDGLCFGHAFMYRTNISSYLIIDFSDEKFKNILEEKLSNIVRAKKSAPGLKKALKTLENDFANPSSKTLTALQDFKTTLETNLSSELKLIEIKQALKKLTEDFSSPSGKTQEAIDDFKKSLGEQLSSIPEEHEVRNTFKNLKEKIIEEQLRRDVQVKLKEFKQLALSLPFAQTKSSHQRPYKINSLENVHDSLKSSSTDLTDVGEIAETPPSDSPLFRSRSASVEQQNKNDNQEKDNFSFNNNNQTEINEPSSRPMSICEFKVPPSRSNSSLGTNTADVDSATAEHAARSFEVNLITEDNCQLPPALNIQSIEKALSNLAPSVEATVQGGDIGETEKSSEKTISSLIASFMKSLTYFFSKKNQTSVRETSINAETVPEKKVRPSYCGLFTLLSALKSNNKYTEQHIPSENAGEPVYRPILTPRENIPQKSTPTLTTPISQKTLKYTHAYRHT